MKKVKNKVLQALLVIFFISACSQESKNKGSNVLIKEQDPYKLVALMNKAIQQHKLDPIKNAEELDVIKGSIALAFLNRDDFENFERYVSLMKNKFNQTSYMNMAAEILSEKGNNKDYTEKLAKKTIVLYESYKDDPAARPGDFNKDDWARFMKMAAFPYYEAYARALYSQGKMSLALYYEEKAMRIEKTENLLPASAELYSSLLIAEHQDEKAYNLLLKEAELGKATKVMLSQLKTLHTQLKGGDSEAFMNSIQMNVKNTIEKEVAGTMITGKRAFNFTLQDLNGGSVSLESLRGKVVVIDFWATWCAPCIRSIPVMNAMSKKNTDVVFLFIATQEKGSDVVQHVREFVKKHNFSFRGLIDIRDKTEPQKFVTLSHYGITGIPAKVVIDKKGYIRFSSSGFTSENELSNELQAMIDITKKQ